MPPTSGLHVAIDNDTESVYKHWCLFINRPTDDEKTILNAMGSSTRYYFEMRTADASKSPTLAEMIHLCDVPDSTFPAIKKAAESAVIHNEYPGYNCQDYVLELLDGLEKEGIIDG
ncbi:hypothetical protein BO71DRAFT_402462 [Aspergillus ellipticus CBS 707.79]|uniref:Uncharacterized protein n=1 Tax=Aspergillus ellipticus CBS 707.79 TaxID=1448320 RepID=A0A319CYQ3_9EURO|nr:hypothetical protein BO71DRAFT_402462 [Aspergillus ellipticus CBS 707.79]